MLLPKPTIYLNNLPWYNPKSILSHLEDPNLPLLDVQKSADYFIEFSSKVYRPLLAFMLQHKILSNLIVTGNFLRFSLELAPENLDLLKELIYAQLVDIAVATFYGDDLSCFYHMESWAKNIIRSVQTLREVLQVEPKYIFISQIFRALEVERVIYPTGIQSFLVRQKGSRLLPFELKMSELRRFNGSPVSWINEQNDVVCQFTIIPDNLFFEPNRLLLVDQLEEQLKKLAMEIGLLATVSQLKHTESKTKKPTAKTGLRINEYYSLALYSDLERAVLRLWQHMLGLILSTLCLQPNNPKILDLYDLYLRLQNKDFLFYLQKTSYNSKVEKNFISPYEAFATMQTAFLKLQVCLEN